MKKIAIILGSFISLLYVVLSVYAIWPVEEFSTETFAKSSDLFININGVNIRYIEEGQRGNDTIVLVHGFAGSVYTFRKIIPLLSDTHHVIALDLPGFGLSDKPSDYDYSYKNQGRMVSDFISQLSLNDVSLFGHSMGGNIVLNAALDNTNIESLVLLDPGIIDDGNPEFLKYLFFPLTRISAKMFRDEDFRMTSFEHAYLYPENITEADVKAYMTASQTENFVNSLVNMLKNYSDPTEIEIVPLIDQPVLLLWGRYDKGNPPENGEILDDIFSNSRFYIIEESGHYIHEEQPQNTADYIKDFLEDYLM